MTMDLVKALLVGICAAAPAGPVLLMVFQRSIRYGHRTGWVTGLGGTVCDTVWAAVSLLAISLVHDYIDSYLGGLQVIGGLLIIGIGVAIAMSKQRASDASERENSKPGQYFLQALGCAFGNPGALAFMMGLVGLFRLSAATLTVPVWLAVLFVAIGSCAYWWQVSLLLGKFGPRLRPGTQARVTRLSGIAVAVFGLVVVIRGITML